MLRNYAHHDCKENVFLNIYTIYFFLLNFFLVIFCLHSIILFGFCVEKRCNCIGEAAVYLLSPLSHFLIMLIRCGVTRLAITIFCCIALLEMIGDDLELQRDI